MVEGEFSKTATAVVVVNVGNSDYCPNTILVQGLDMREIMDLVKFFQRMLDKLDKKKKKKGSAGSAQHDSDSEES